jgi:transposase-like protein
LAFIIIFVILAPLESAESHKEIRRRTRVVTLFANEASALRLVAAVLMEISEEWQTDKIYLTMS